MGVGHFVESALPGEDNNCVISGHRDTVFTKVGELQIGDSLIIETSVGIFTYEVTGTKIVEKDDDTIIVPTAVSYTHLYNWFNINRECDIMNVNLMDRKMLKILCAKSVGMNLGDKLYRDRYLVAFHK